MNTRNLSGRNVLLFWVLKSQDKQWEFDVKITWKLWSGGHRGRYLSYFKRKITSHPSCFIIQYTSQPPLSRAIGLAIFMSPMSLWGLKVGRDRDVARQNYPGLPSMCQKLWFSLALSPGHFPAFGDKRVLHTQFQSVCGGGVVSPMPLSQALDTSWVSYNSAQFWHYQPEDSIRFHRVRAQSLNTAPFQSSSLPPLMPFTSLDCHLCFWLNGRFQCLCQTGGSNDPPPTQDGKSRLLPILWL